MFAVISYPVCRVTPAPSGDSGSDGTPGNTGLGRSPLLTITPALLTSLMLVFGIVSGSRIDSGVCEGGMNGILSVVRDGAVSKVRTLLMITSSDRPYSHK